MEGVVSEEESGRASLSSVDFVVHGGGFHLLSRFKPALAAIPAGTWRVVAVVISTVVHHARVPRMVTQHGSVGLMFYLTGEHHLGCGEVRR